ncbi:MAG: bifunctional metallophosphatase/5'-nucleotidase [Pseudomonadota bacterium]
MRRLTPCFAILFLILAAVPAFAAGNGTVTLIQIGDLHGHLVPRPNVRSDSSGRLEGGLARLYTQIQEIRSRARDSLLINTGDTIQGSAETLFTRGQAMVDVLNRFGIDAFAPGNWDFLYGTQRFQELFCPASRKAPWHAVAANLYYDGAPYAAWSGQRVLPPYEIRPVGGLRIGILGFTTFRGIPILNSTTQGFKFTPGDAELAELIPVLREREKVDLVVMVSELGLADNIRLAESHPGVDVILSADMHEATIKPVVTKTGTIISEVGQDGTLLGELQLQVSNGKLSSWRWQAHVIDDRLAEDPGIAALVREVRKSFVSGPDFTPHINPFNGSVLKQPLDTVVGYTQVPLYRGNFSTEGMPGVIEGSSHDFLADAFRSMTGAEIGAIRGFRYGTHVAPGPITLADLYHFMPIGAQIAVGEIQGRQLKAQMENAADGSLNPDVSIWSGGWLFGYSGVRADLHPYHSAGSRFSNVQVFNRQNQAWMPLDPNVTYTYASYYYDVDPKLVNLTPANHIRVLKDDGGRPLDATEVVVRYLQSLPNRTVTPELNRIRLLDPLPPPLFGNPEIQPLKGLDAANAPLPAGGRPPLQPASSGSAASGLAAGGSTAGGGCVLAAGTRFDPTLLGLLALSVLYLSRRRR